MISSSSQDSCGQLVAGNYDVLVGNEPPSSLKSVLRDFIRNFEQYEYELYNNDQYATYANDFKLLKEYSKILKENKANLQDGEQEYNLRKNRYKDILPFSHTRVQLSSDPLIPGSEYINANYIRGPSGSSQAYIACQGPLECTLNDFWRMIWECNVSVVIMACNEEESGKPKCELYWPEQIGSSQRYGNIQVQLVKVRQICSDFLIRKFSVKLLQPFDAVPQQQQQQQQQPSPAVVVSTNSATTTTICSPSTTTTTTTTTTTNIAIDNLSIGQQVQPLGQTNNFIEQHNNITNQSEPNINQVSPNDQQQLMMMMMMKMKSDSNNNITNHHHHHHHQRQQPSLNSPPQCNGGGDGEGEGKIVLMERTICQFHYTTWPDHGAPESVQPILELVRLVRDVQPAEDRPILVHCSAGCGRTGTICCIDFVWGLLRRGKLDSSFHLYSIISEMRQQRMAMVQTLEQYILCHRAVAALFLNQLKLIDNHHYENDDDDDVDGANEDDNYDDDDDDEDDGGGGGGEEEEEEDLRPVFI